MWGVVGTIVVHLMNLLFYMASFAGTPLGLSIFYLWSHVQFWYTATLQWAVLVLWAAHWHSARNLAISTYTRALYFGEIGIDILSIMILLWNRKHLDLWYQRELYLLRDKYAAYRY